MFRNTSKLRFGTHPQETDFWIFDFWIGSLRNSPRGAPECQTKTIKNCSQTFRDWSLRNSPRGAPQSQTKRIKNCNQTFGDWSLRHLEKPPNPQETDFWIFCFWIWSLRNSPRGAPECQTKTIKNCSQTFRDWSLRNSPRGAP